MTNKTTGDAVDRASSVKPLDDDQHIDPAHISETVRKKQQKEHAKRGEPNVGPVPVEAQSNRERIRD